MKFSLILLLVASTTYVSAHGTLRRISINGKNFEGNAPGSSNPNPSVIREVSTQDPNKGASNPALTCGPNSGLAALVADVNPGDSIGFDWRTANDGKWVHNIGPMLTYMSSCGTVTCDKFDQSNAQWFKIDQVGRKSNNSAEWVQNDLFEGGTAVVKIPTNIAPGNYLVRHEIIALHLATSSGGAEFYPGCVQVRVGGSGTGVPSQSDLVKIPGAYQDGDPGIFDPSVFDPSAPYVFPGPAVATFVTGQGSPSSSPSSSTEPSASPSSSDVPQPSPSPSSPPKICKKKRPASSSSSSSSLPNPSVTLVAAGDGGSNAAPSPSPSPTPGSGSGTGYSGYRRRNLGHIMRRWAFENTFH